MHLKTVFSHLKHTDSWMVLNRLKLNQDKTELLLISSRYRQSLALNYLQVGEKKICLSESVRNLGVHFDQHARMHVHVKNVCQASFYYLKNINKTRRYLSQDATEILIHAYITSRLDNCNSPLYGLPSYMINKLQTIQNAAARIVTSERKLVISLLFYASFTGCQFNIELFLKCYAPVSLQRSERFSSRLNL